MEEIRDPDETYGVSSLQEDSSRPYELAHEAFSRREARNDAS